MEKLKPKLLLPVRDIKINQPFGANYLDFYKKLGLKGHNGIDFKAKRGCKVLASHSGVVTWAGKDRQGGISVTIEKTTKGNGYKTIYYHLQETKVKKGDRVGQGSIIGLADNTGKYTTGDHLHFGLKFIENNKTANYNNGYRGAVDPAPYFEKLHGKKWYMPAAYHRYGRRQEYWAEFKMRFKNPWLHRQLIKRHALNKVYDSSFINALVYGGWDFNTVVNPAMHDIWAYMKKTEYINGRRPFI